MTAPPSGRHAVATVERRNAWTLHTATAAILLSVLLVLCLFTERGINNGDWYRVTQYGGFYPSEWAPMEGSYGFRHEPRMARSTTMGMTVGALALASRQISASAFPAAMAIGIFHVLFVGGVALMLFGTTVPRRHLIGCALIIAYFCFGCYLNCFYEETTVLALVPLLCFAYIRMREGGNCLPFAMVASAIVYSKIQMIIVAPIFAVALWMCVGARLRKPSSIVALVCLAAATVLSANSVHSQNKDPNSFNRLYNGVGWSLLDSWKWPATEFKGRHTYYYENRESLQPDAGSLPNPELLGASYWPTGLDMRRAATDDLGRARYARVVTEGREPTYIGHLLRNPHAAALLVSNTYLTTVLSDYATRYVRSDPLVPGAVSRMLQHAREAILRYFGALCAVAIILWCVVQRTWTAVLTAACVALIPMLVVMGDGFFEFEKHMVPYLMLMPLFVAMALAPPTPRTVMGDTTTRPETAAASQPHQSRTVGSRTGADAPRKRGRRGRA